MTHKPLEKKCYGSIGHLPSSRLGTGDYCVPLGQAKIATKKVRDSKDCVIVQEKLDGSNVGIAKIDGKVHALIRAGYLARTSPYRQHILFADWVDYNYSRFDELLYEDERICGEWLAMVHSTHYNLPHEPFVAFDIITGKVRCTYREIYVRASRLDIITPRVLHNDNSPYSVEQMLEAIKSSGHGAIDDVEGGVWRVERDGKVDFLTKYVRHDHVSGKHLAELTGGKEIWNIDLETFLK